jgi:hypothetical protein
MNYMREGRGIEETSNSKSSLLGLLTEGNTVKNSESYELNKDTEMLENIILDLYLVNNIVQCNIIYNTFI